jgi:hypothetical protein
VEEKLVKVARFICSACRLAISLLPAFVLPYRSRLVKKVDTYFMAEDKQRQNMADHELMRRYWKQWKQHMAAVQRDSGWPPGQSLKREPRHYWMQIRAVAGNMASAHRVLIERYGISLLRYYVCHQC